MYRVKLLLVAAVLYVASSASIAKTLADRQLEFAVSVPEQAKIDVVENEKGRSVTAVHQDPSTREAFTVQAVRANNGGFDRSPAAFFAGMMDGVSKTVGKRASAIRTLHYLDHELHVAQHVGVGENNSQTLITIAFLQERGSWRKVITVQLICNGNSIRDDEYILGRLKAAQFRPVV